MYPSAHTRGHDPSWGGGGGQSNFQGGGGGKVPPSCPPSKKPCIRKRLDAIKASNPATHSTACTICVYTYTVDSAQLKSVRPYTCLVSCTYAQA